MGQLFKTNLVIVSAPLPADFKGTPQEFYSAMVERMEIQSPAGTSFFIIGDVEPASNQGPWLKNGDKWYVWSDTLGRYVPADITDSLPSFFVVSDTTPANPGTDDALIWLKTFSDRVLGWYFWNGITWRPGGNTPPSGPTSERPSVPQDLEQFFDTDINTLIHWERGAWRTVSGTPGDVKFVTTSILADAITANPGWEYLGETTQAWRGRVLGVASKDPGGSPVASYLTDAGITQQESRAVAGEETHILTSTETEQHTHLVGALTALNSGNDIYLHRVDDADIIDVPPIIPPNHARVLGEGTSNGTKTGALPTTAAGTQLITSRQLSLTDNASYTAAAAPHNTLQPTVYLWALVKT